MYGVHIDGGRYRSGGRQTIVFMYIDARAYGSEGSRRIRANRSGELHAIEYSRRDLEGRGGQSIHVD